MYDQICEVIKQREKYGSRNCTDFLVYTCISVNVSKEWHRLQSYLHCKWSLIYTCVWMFAQINGVVRVGTTWNKQFLTGFSPNENSVFSNCVRFLTILESLSDKDKIYDAAIMLFDSMSSLFSGIRHNIIYITIWHAYFRVCHGTSNWFGIHLDKSLLA